MQLLSKKLAATVATSSCCAVLMLLAGCVSTSKPTVSTSDQTTQQQPLPTDSTNNQTVQPGYWPDSLPDSSKQRLPANKTTAKGKLKAVHWSDLPGFLEDNLAEAWNAWLKNCLQPAANNAKFCSDVRQLSIASEQQKRVWLMTNFQPYLLQNRSGHDRGLLTAYYEPVLHAKRQADASFDTPLHALPNNFNSSRKWHSRSEIDNNASVKRQLERKIIAYLDDPVMAMKLHIQGSGRIAITEADGSISYSRVAFAGTNNHQYRSIANVLLHKGYIKSGSWAAIHAWSKTAPKHLTKSMMAQNPRYVFFREERLDASNQSFGPNGAQGVPLTPGRSIAVDPSSIPYGSVVWLESSGPSGKLAKLVFAQDTGSAIKGNIRADYFVGWDETAEAYASTMKQNLRLWLILPKK